MRNICLDFLCKLQGFETGFFFAAISLKMFNTNPAVLGCTVSITYLSPEVLLLHFRSKESQHITGQITKQKPTRWAASAAVWSKHHYITCLCLNWPLRHSRHFLRMSDADKTPAGDDQKFSERLMQFVIV